MPKCIRTETQNPGERLHGEKAVDSQTEKEKQQLWFLTETYLKTGLFTSPFGVYRWFY